MSKLSKHTLNGLKNGLYHFYKKIIFFSTTFNTLLLIYSEPYVNALVDERFEEAIKEAEAFDLALANDSNPPSGSLLGVPFTGKDSHAVKGLAWTAGLVARKVLEKILLYFNLISLTRS